MAYRLVPFPVISNDLEARSPAAGLFICNATFRTVSSDTAHRAVPRQQLSFLCYKFEFYRENVGLGSLLT